MTVNEALTAQPKVENPEYAAMLRRLFRAYGARVGESDPYDLGDMLAVARELDSHIGAAVTRLHQRGYSWADIGEGAGLTRQAAQQRWGRVPPRRARTV